MAALLIATFAVAAVGVLLTVRLVLREESLRAFEADYGPMFAETLRRHVERLRAGRDDRSALAHIFNRIKRNP